MKTGHALLLFAALNAVLYSALLPLWEGFDEPFHFGYVQHLANRQGYPDARAARLSNEVALSILGSPASPSVKDNLPDVVTYSEFFSWSAARRAAAQRSVRDISPESRWAPSQFLNYEAHQAPLAYVFLAVPEYALRSVPIPSRVLILRILAALAGSLLLYVGASSLATELGLDETYRNSALFCIFCSQMTWATFAHVANDFLAVPLAVCTLALLVRYVSAPTMTNIAVASAVLSAGLLTKAYFLALVPVLAGICAVRREWRRLAVALAIVGICAGPWYVRNYRLYGVITGMQEARSGIGLAAVLGAAPHLNWPKVAVDSVRDALWTANNTFRTFSLATIDIVILVCVAALLLWVFSRHEVPEWIVVAYCGAFLAALAYAAVVANIATRGASSTPSPWYAQVLASPLLVLAVLGSTRRRAGLALAAALPLLFGYVLAVTYVFKLIPLYGGYEGRGTVRDIATLYLSQFGSLSSNLGSVALAPAWLIFTLAAAVVVSIAVLEVLLMRSLAGELRYLSILPTSRHAHANSAK